MRFLRKYPKTAISVAIVLINSPFALSGLGVHTFLCGAFSVFALWDYCEERK